MKSIDRSTAEIICLILSVLLVIGMSAPVFAANGFRYEHDPRLNPSAMADIVEDENAIYGFRPSETGSLKAYASENWSDPEFVAAGRAERIAYHKSIESMYTVLDEMMSEGKGVEEIARALSAMRNEIRLAVYADDPEGLAAVKARNLEQYGHEEGPLPDELYAKYGSWETVLAKSFSVNSGMDACLGLYDEYYLVYVAAMQVTDDTDGTAAPVPTGDDPGIPVVIALTALTACSAAALIPTVGKRRTYGGR